MSVAFSRAHHVASYQASDDGRLMQRDCGTLNPSMLSIIETFFLVSLGDSETVKLLCPEETSATLPDTLTECVSCTQLKSTCQARVNRSLMYIHLYNIVGR